MGLKSNDKCPSKRQKRRHKHREEGHPKTEAEIGLSDATTSQGTAKDCWKPPEARREAWNRFSLGASRRNEPCPHLDFRLQASTTTAE